MNDNGDGGRPMVSITDATPRSPSSALHVLSSRQWVSTSLENTFAFFSEAINLEALTPPFLHFSVRTPVPIEMRTGASIEYRLRLFGLPLAWVSRIEDWEPNRGFTDVQLEGPYARCIHRHTFAPSDGGTTVIDQVEYALPAEPWSEPVRAFFVRPVLERIFAYRRDAMVRRLG